MHPLGLIHPFPLLSRSFLLKELMDLDESQAQILLEQLPIDYDSSETNIL